MHPDSENVENSGHELVNTWQNGVICLFVHGNATRKILNVSIYFLIYYLFWLIAFLYLDYHVPFPRSIYFSH